MGDEINENTMDFTFSNSTDNKICIWFEPWAEGIWVDPGLKVVIKIYYINPGIIEAEQTDKFFVIWLWRGCRAQVLVDGQDRTAASFKFRAPG